VVFRFYDSRFLDRCSFDARVTVFSFFHTLFSNGVSARGLKSSFSPAKQIADISVAEVVVPLV
jgi:hypothetical protein